MDIATQKLFAEAIDGSNKRVVTPYNAKAKVKSISDGAIYVQIEGSDIVTPVKTSTVSVKVGDVVDISVSHDDTHITGNRSDVSASSATTENISKALDKSTIEMTNKLNIMNNEITALNNKINIQNSEINVQNSKLDIMNSSIISIGSSISTIESNISTQGSKIETMESDISTIESNISTIESNISTQGSKIETIESNISTIESNISTIESNISTQGSKIETIKSNISTIESNISTQGSKIETIESNISTQGSKIETIESNVSTQGSKIETIESNISTQGSKIQTIESDIEIINSAFVIKDGTLTGISEIITNILDSDYVTTDLLNANVGWIVDGHIKEGAIGTVEIADSSITTAKISELSADVITSGTIRTERLILTTDEINPATGEKKVALITALNAKANSGEGNILDGAIISDNSITAAKIDVVDLNAFGATIGNFKIGTSNMYNNKKSLDDPTNGVYIGTDGIALGQGSLLDMTDDSPFRVESDGDFHLGGRDNNYINFDPFTGELNIAAKTIKMDSKTVSEIAKDAVDMLKIGGRNLILCSETLASEEHTIRANALTYSSSFLTYGNEHVTYENE